MRILANYGHKTNGSSYNVTFESMGDQKMENAKQLVDELFRLAREAVQRQIDGDLEFPPKEEITIPQPRRNGNGKPQVRDPESPATSKQLSLIYRLAKEHNRFIQDVNELSKGKASELISELMAV